MTFTGPGGGQQPTDRNLFGQDQWARRGDAQAATAASSVALPVGAMTAYCGATAPAGWLLCDGSTFSSSSYPTLASLLGGTTLPDLRQKFPMGKAASGTGSTLGGTGGSKDQTVTTHSHNHGHAPVTVGDENNLHGHDLLTTQTFGTSNTAHTHYIGGYPGEMSAAPQGSGRAQSYGGYTDNQGVYRHQHTVTLTADATSAGSSGTDANLPPYTVVNWIIKAG